MSSLNVPQTPRTAVVNVPGGLVKNAGPNTVYYRAASGVSPTTNDGSIASGSSVTLTGTTHFTAAVATAAGNSTVYGSTLLVPSGPRTPLLGQDLARMIVVTQAVYDAIAVPDSDTLYVIVG